MPLFSVPAIKALSTLKQNRFAFWPDGRRDGTRLESLVLAEGTPSFRMLPGGTVFTAGSCFARNIEAQLAQSGFQVPAMEVSLPEEERASSTTNDILNKYNPHSIVNELIWAFEKPFPEDAYLDLGNKLWHDPHLAGNVKPAQLNRVMERRAMVTRLFRLLPRCSYVVITLGLVEAWYDEQTGLYLNGTPPLAAVRNQPDRFRLDVLSHDEITSELNRLWDLVQKHGKPKTRMLITVSPVPLKATYTGQDVLVANTYSKSVLRAAVAQFVATHKGIDYFPSYEAATLTSRSIAFLEDNRHVSPELVKAIIGRVIGTYVRNEDTEEAALEESAEDSTKRISRRVRELFKKGKHHSALVLLREVAANGNFRAARYSEFQFYCTYASALAETDHLLEAEMAINRAIEKEPESAMAHYARARILSRLSKPMAAEDAFRMVVTLSPGNADAHRRLARFEARNGKLVEAEETTLAALAIEPGHKDSLALLAEIRAAAGKDWGPDDSDSSGLPDPSKPTEEGSGKLRGFIRGLTRA